MLRLVERLQSFLVEDVLVGDFLAGWRCSLCGQMSSRLRCHARRVAWRRLLELLLRRRQLLSGDASSHVDILLYFLHSHRLMELFLYLSISFFPGLLVLYLLQRFCTLSLTLTSLFANHSFRSLCLRRPIVWLIFKILHLRHLHFRKFFGFLSVGDVGEDLRIGAQRSLFGVILTQL